MAVKPEEIGIHKSFNSFNTGQLEDTYGVEKEQERGGATLSKLYNIFCRKFCKIFFVVEFADIFCMTTRSIWSNLNEFESHDLSENNFGLFKATRCSSKICLSENS